jgi:hypothetical protein
MATLNQLAGFIREEWEEQPMPDTVSQSLKLLSALDDPDEVEVIGAAYRYLYLIHQFTDAWDSQYAALITQEISKRVKRYERMLQPEAS